MQSLFQFTSSGLNWVDAIIILVIIFYGFEGSAIGGVLATFDLVTFVLSFLTGIKTYVFVSSFLVTIFHMSRGYANAVAFFLIACAVELLLHILLIGFIKKVNKNINENKAIPLWLGNFIGILPGVLSGVVLLMFLLTVMVGLPISPFLKGAVTMSKIGSFLVGRSQIVEGELANIFGGAATDTLNFFTVEPQSNATVPLDFSVDKTRIDQSSETAMVALVNNERAKQGEDALLSDPKLQSLARSYAQYMLDHRYFSHYTPEGLSPFDRMSQQDIVFQYGGENLAFSANVTLAMQGLMNSKGHRDNILSKNFHRIGIGVVDSGMYGEMFVQEFTD